MKKFFAVLLIFVVVLIAVVVVARNTIVKVVAQTATQKILGLPLEIEDVNVGISESLIDIRGLKLHNPQGFEDYPLMADAPEIFVDYELSPLLGGNVILDSVRFHLKEFYVVRRADGSTNLDFLKTFQKAEQGEKPEPKQEGEAAVLEVRNLKLQIDTVKLVTYDRDGRPQVQEFRIGINEEHKDIESLEALAGLIVFKALTKTTISTLLDINPEMLGNFVAGSIGTATDAATGILQGTANTTKEVIGVTEGTLKNTGETLKKTTEGITNILSNPFGSSKETPAVE